MRAYEVFLNGKRLCLAGIGRHGYVSAYVTYVSEQSKTDIDIVGLVASKKLYVRWTRRALRTGDEVRIKIVDRKTVDKFRKIGRVDSPDRVVKLQKRMVRRMAKEFGWEVREKPKTD
jgi:DNA-directed RNA polymerase subunit E'/Rpb7